MKQRDNVRSARGRSLEADWSEGSGTLAVGADQSGEVGDERDGREVGDVGDLQGPQQRLQPLRAEPAGARFDFTLKVLFYFESSNSSNVSLGDLRGLRSMQTLSKMSLRNCGALSCTTCCTRRRDFRYSRKRFRKPTKCSAVRMEPGTASDGGGQQKHVTNKQTNNCFQGGGTKPDETLQNLIR